MPALQFDDESVVDPDSLKMPETSAHRTTVDLIGLAATRLLSDEFRVFRDMNWYPTDGGGPMAPDLMVLPAAALEADPTSYRQDRDGGPAPTVAFEVPSESDTFASFRAQAFRYRALGTVVYLVVTDRPAPAVLRLAPGDAEPRLWEDEPIGELAGLRLGFDDGRLVATLPDGVRAHSDAELLAAIEERAAAAERRVAELARRLEALGVDPDDQPDPD